MDPDAVPDVGRVRHGGTDDTSLVDFSANTNPERPPGVAGVYESALAAARRYPADDYSEFRTAAADHVGCAPRSVIPAAGAMAAIRLALSVAVGPGDSVLVPTPSFGEYAREVSLQGGEPEFVPHDEIVEADLAGHAAAVVCHPNNPTGEAYNPRALRWFAGRCREAGTVLLLDEAYLDFTDLSSLAGERGVVVLRSLTKMFGLPGLRAGFAVAVNDLRDRLDAARPAWGLSTPAAAVGRHCLRQEAFVERTRKRVAREREHLREGLEETFDVWPSDAPFLLLDAGDRDVDTILDHARERELLLRDARTFRGLDSHLRIAVRRRAENDRLLDALADV